LQPSGSTLQTFLPSPSRGYHGHGPPAEPLSRDAIRAVQSRLRQLGFYFGRIDGIWGPSMQASLQRLSTGSWPTSDGTAESCNRDGTWSGSEQSCLPSGNYRPSRVIANPVGIMIRPKLAARLRQTRNKSAERLRIR
jgi:peptidoglycan hydrolase-like protein with peptidoglycan-binding domain